MISCNLLKLCVRRLSINPNHMADSSIARKLCKLINCSTFF